MEKFFLTLLLTLLCQSVWADSLRGGRAPRAEAYQEAKKHQVPFVSSEAEIKTLLQQDRLVRLVSETHFEVDEQVSYPYVLPEVRIFAQRMGEYLHEVCGERMVITSALRLTTQKLRNSISDTVHPTGMALDIRLPPRKCRKWFEARKKYLEYKGVIQATRERWPPHYHVVVYPKQYAMYISESANRDLALYEIQRGDTLSDIALLFGTTITELVIINGLESPDRLRAGQKLRLR
jgi:hypothetical protein